jgi:sortase A
MVVGLGCLGWVGYQHVGTNLVSERAFVEQAQRLRSTWERPPATPVPSSQQISDDTGAEAIEEAGEQPAATALLRVPALGPEYEVPVLPGTDSEVLARGVGHYLGSARPGEVGNVALAGHRVTHGEPFRRLLELEVGSEIVIETARAVHVYVVDVAPRSRTVADAEGCVLAAVPCGYPGSERRLLTLTTCEDLFRSDDRSVAHGHLLWTVPKP